MALDREQWKDGREAFCLLWDTNGSINNNNGCISWKKIFMTDT